MEKAKKPIWKRPWALAIVVVLILAAIGLVIGGGESAATQEMLESIEYYETTVLDEIPALAEQQDSAALVSAYDAAIERLNADTAKYAGYMDDESLTDAERQAAQDIKTGFYGAVSSALEPMRAVFAGESTDVPDYESAIDAANNYVWSAKEALR